MKKRVFRLVTVAVLAALVALPALARPLEDGASSHPSRELVHRIQVAFCAGLHADIYYPPPADTEGSYPVAFVINAMSTTRAAEHYGAPLLHTGPAVELLTQLANAGYAAVMSEVSECCGDTCTLMDYLAANAEGLSLDMDRVALLAYGPHANLALRMNAENREKFPGSITGIALLYPDLTTNVPELDGAIPILVVRSDDDNAVMNRRMAQFMEQAAEQGIELEVVDTDSGPHDYDGPEGAACCRAYRKNEVASHDTEFAFPAFTLERPADTAIAFFDGRTR